MRAIKYTKRKEELEETEITMDYLIHNVVKRIKSETKNKK